MNTVSLHENQLLALLMATVQVEENISLKMIREKFMKRDRQWTESEARAEYRFREAKAIMSRIHNEGHKS